MPRSLNWCAQIARLRAAGTIGTGFVGAVAEAMRGLGWPAGPHLHGWQRLRGGQMGLVQAWESAFRGHQLRAAQVLLTHEDVADRGRYLNARGTLNTLLELGVVPVVNENDTVATDEIRLGDNDTLAALTVNLTEPIVL